MHILRILLIIAIKYDRIFSEIYSLILLERGILCFVRIAEISVLTAQNSASHAAHHLLTINSKTKILSLILAISRLIINSLISSINSQTITSISNQTITSISNQISTSSRTTISLISNHISSTRSMLTPTTVIR